MTRGGNTRKTGARYELLAAVHLEKCGYHIIEKNYRCRIGEIDLVYESSRDLCRPECPV